MSADVHILRTQSTMQHYLRRIRKQMRALAATGGFGLLAYGSGVSGLRMGYSRSQEAGI